VEHRDESPEQQLTRNISDLLGELRVAQAGVQILFGFLLSVVFTAQYRAASGFEKSLHLSAVLLAVLATALLTAPAVWHRILFRQGRREDILRVGNRTVLVGLICLSAALTVTVALIALVVFGSPAMVVCSVVVCVLFAGLWFVLPFLLRRGPE
jgi:preprotein translocase subunit SecY